MSFEKAPETVASLDRLIGRLESRVESLESRADQQERTLIQMDGKLDDIKIMLATSAGGRERMNTLAKYGIAFLGAIGSVSAIIVGLIHYLVGNLNAR